jgi:hypothetical protein
MRVPAALLLLGVGLTACRFVDSGTGADGGPPLRFDADTSVPPVVDAFVLPPSDTRPVLPLQSQIGAGCWDGTREGFREAASFPHIAGCAGAWSVPGLLSAEASQPQCGRSPGATGQGCSVADLCAPGWHVCRDGHDVETHSATGSCEGALPSDEAGFFLVRAGATPQGVCSPEPSPNDLHGCGTLGQTESETCAPLSRRMTFADCLATDGDWYCGDVCEGQPDGGVTCHARDKIALLPTDESLMEALVVTKSTSTMGGVLCCED